MAFASTNPDLVHVDLEAQQVLLQPSQPREMHSIGTRQLETTSVASQASTASSGQEADSKTKTQPIVSLPTSDSGGGETHETDGRRSEHVDATGQTPTRVELGEIQVGAQTQPTPEVDPNSGVDNSPPIDVGPASEGSNRDPEEKPMIGDFDASANALWTLYGEEAKGYDQSRIQTLKDNMDGVLIFAGLYSAVLTSFIIDSKQNLKPNPPDQMVYYLQQNVAMLTQISQQISFVVPQFAIPATPPPPFPTFNPSATDIRINAFWFMALVFSLSAGLLAILVQQWVRDYLHVFQRYSDPLKSARIRQYLFEGLEGWRMPMVAKAVPGLLHVSLFLFFMGLGDFVLNINTTVGLSTTVPIGISGMLYIFSTFAPVLFPQSPYRNSFSGVIWYIIQKSKLFGRRFKDRDGTSKFVNTNMAKGLMQLAMEETEDRKGRDVKAIRWMVGNLTEDGEMESFAMAIPGSFNGGWSFDVWTKLSHITEDENTHRSELITRPVTDIPVQCDPPVVGQPSPFRAIANRCVSVVRLIRMRTASHPRTNMMPLMTARHSPNTHPPAISTDPTSVHVMRELSSRIAHLFETCKNRGSFASDELWRKRTRACVMVTPSLICYADAELGQFGDILRTLADIGGFEKTRELSSEGRDQSFVMRWTCLSMMAIRRALSDSESLKVHAKSAIASYRAFRDGDGPEDEVTEKNAREMERLLKNKYRLLLRKFLQNHRDTSGSQEILEHLNEVIDQDGEFQTGDELRLVDSKISFLRERIHGDCFAITQQFAFIRFKLDSESYDQLFLSLRNPPESPFIFPSHILNTLSHHYQNDPLPFLVGQHSHDVEWALTWEENLNNLLQRQLWRLQDLRDGGGLGFTVELFLLALKQLLSASPSPDFHSALYTGTFRAITSDWRDYKHSIGTQKLLLDAVASEQGFVHWFNYPTYITDELLALLERMLEGQTGPHIENAVQQLLRPISRPDDHPWVQEFRGKALKILSPLR